MKILSTLILLLFGAMAYGQLDTVSLSVADFGVPSIEGQADFVKNEAYKINVAITEMDTLLEPPHLFIYFGDSAVSKSYTTSWAHLTNDSDSLFIQTELDAFTMSNDTITATYGGHYDFSASFAHDGDNLETVSIRLYNATQAAGIPVAGANTMRAANNFMSTSVLGYAHVNAGDEIVIQYKGDASGTSVFKNGVLNIIWVHGL